MDISKIISDVGAYSVFSKPKVTEDTPKVQDNNAVSGVKAETLKNASELVVQIIQESENNAPSKDSISKENLSKGQFIDKRV